MDVRTNFERKDKRVEVKDIPVLEEKPKTIRLVLLRNTNYRVEGSVTKNIYVFNGAGSALDVDERDAPALLDKRRNSCNCSGMPGQPYFQII